MAFRELTLALYPPPSSLFADDFVNHFEKKVDDIRSLFTQPIESTGPTHTEVPYTLTSFSPLSPDEILLLVGIGGRMTFNLRLFRARMGVVAMRQDSSY